MLTLSKSFRKEDILKEAKKLFQDNAKNKMMRLS